MRKFRTSKWVWYLVLGAVITGLFVPTMVAQAAIREVPVSICPTPDPA